MPSNIGLSYDAVSFATTNAGSAQIQGWWIPSTASRYTALYLHDEKGNLGDTLETLAGLHAAGLSVLAFDYRGYGQSQFERPSENRWREDAEHALDYLTGTRHIDPRSIVLVGNGLGGNLALEIAAAHSELAGVVLESPIDAPVNIIFNDARARMVPARLLVRDRYDLMAPAKALHIPSLWLLANPRITDRAATDAFARVSVPKTAGELPRDRNIAEPVKSWLTGLSK